MLLHLLWRQHTYGAWLPNTWFIKQFGGLLRGSYGVWYVEAWARGVGLLAILPLLPWLRARHLVLVVPIVGTLAYAWWIGGDFMAHGRFLVVATALLAVLVGWLLADAGLWLRSRVRALARVPIAELLTLGLAALLGVSPRAALALVQAARAKALLDARDYVLPDDVKQLSASVLAHRLVLTPEAEMDGTSADDILTQTLSRVSLRRG